MARKPTAGSLAVTGALMKLGFPPAFSELIGRELHTDFTALWMLRYLEAAKPDTMELVAEEMLEILAFRDRCVQKHILND